MSIRQIDPLLAIANAIVLFCQAALALAAAAIAIAVPAVILLQGDITPYLREELGDPGFVLPAVQVAALLVMALGIVALLFLFLRTLRRIIRTVAQGDPFVPANADRLTLMAWLMVGVEVLTLIMMSIGWQVIHQLAAANPDNFHADTSWELDFTGPFLILTLFILARVFRQGAAMRADLEGTV